MTLQKTPKPRRSSPPAAVGYSSTDVAEIEALNAFRSALDPARVKADLKERDKHPNIDGYLELVDDQGIPAGKLEVQVRSIRAGARKYQCPTSLFRYTNLTALPVLLICVDTKARAVYWKHLKYEDIRGKESQDSVSISFQDPEDTVSRTGTCYNKWLLVARDYCERIRRFDALEEIARRATPLIGQKSDEVRKIQIFIDELNTLLDHSYSCLKRTFFPGVWKIGFGLQGWTEERIQYLLFSIEEGRNDPLIKQIEPGLDIFKDPDIGFYSHYGDNQLRRDPKSAARRFVLDRMKKLIRSDGLSIRSDFLAREFLFDFIDSHLECLGLEKKDKYEGLEIYRAFHEYLPRWADAARRAITYPSHNAYFDPTLAQMMMRKSISEEVNQAVNKKLPFGSIYIGSSQVSYRQLYDLAEFARSTGKSVERLYRRSTLPRTGPWIWSEYSDEDSLFDLRVIFENFKDVYRSFVALNGMDYAVLRPFSSKSNLLIFYTPPKMSHTPAITELQLVSKEKPDGTPFVRVLKGPALPIERDNSGHPNLVFEGKTYWVQEYLETEATFLFQRTPMLTLIYETLERKLTAILEQTGQGNRHE